MACCSKRCVIAIMAFFGHMFLAWLQMNNKTYNGLSSQLTPQEISTANFVYSIGFGLTCFTGILVTRFGGARMFGFAISAAAKINLMTSFVFSKMGIVGLLNLVFVEGVFHALASCAVCDLWSRWSPLEDRLKLLSASYAGTFVADQTFEALEDNVDRSHLYYITAGLPLIWSIIWLFFVKNSPDDDKRLSEDERKYLAEKVGIVDKERGHFTTYPWKSIFKSKPFQVVCITSFIFSMGTTFSTSATHYGNQKKFPIVTETVMFVATVVILVVAVCVAKTIIEKKNYNRTQLRKFYITSGFTSGGILLICLYCTEYQFFQKIFDESQNFVEIIFLVNIIELSPKYCGILGGIQRTHMTIAASMTPVLVEIITNTYKEKIGWIACFGTITLLYGLGALLYYTWGSAESQSWDGPRKEEYELEKRENVDKA